MLKIQASASILSNLKKVNHFNAQNLLFAKVYTTTCNLRNLFPHHDAVHALFFGYLWNMTDCYGDDNDEVICTQNLPKEHVSNKTMRKLMGVKIVSILIKKCRMQWSGHVRHSRRFKDSEQDRNEWKQKTDWPKYAWIDKKTLQIRLLNLVSLDRMDLDGWRATFDMAAKGRPLASND